MKHLKASRNRAKGFTLMELLVVVSIMVILAGLTMGVMSYVNQKQAIEQAKVQLGLLDLSLEDYHSEQGKYPVSTRSDGKNGTKRIQSALFPANNSEKIYLTELDPDNDSMGWLSGTNAGNIQILDPWGTEYRYRASTATKVVSANPGFDLWSCGPDGETNAGRSGAYDPEDPKNVDDIRLW